MGAVSATFPAAPLDRMARIVTASVWGLAAVFAAVGLVMLGAGSTWVGVLVCWSSGFSSP